MLVTFLLTLTSIQICDSQMFLFQEDNSHLTSCLQNVIFNWNKKATVPLKGITYVDLNYQENDILKAMHEINVITVVSKTADVQVNIQHNAYIVMIDNFVTFKNEFSFITREKSWKPNANMVIVFRHHEPDKITDLFNILLRLHIFDVVVIYSSNDAPMYTYNPFQNKNCGKTFNEIVKYDNCSEATIEKIFFQRPKKDLKGCTFNVSLPDWPPFTMNPSKDRHVVQFKGIEQYLMEILSEKVGFSLSYKFFDDAEEFPVVGKNMTATGTLGLLQKGYVDVVFGGMILTHERASSFDYFHGHHDFEDELCVLVRKAGPVPTWKNIYSEFTYLVWILLVVTFITFCVVFSILFRIKDKCYFILVMWDLLFLHSHKLRLNFKAECFLFQWVIFAFLINTYYQSNLSGLTTHVSHSYQISTTEDLNYYKIEPCLSPLISDYTKAISGLEITNVTNKDCNNLLNSMKVVSIDNTKYTVALLSKYNLNNHKFKDEFGEFLLYKFPIPKSKLIYAVYFYKGFPNLRDLYYMVQRIRETGLLDKRARDISYEVKRKHNDSKHMNISFVLPWQVLVVGYGLSTITFLIEILMDHMKKKRRQDIIFLH